MKVCHVCGTQSVDNSAFCQGCGARFSAPPSSGEGNPAITAPSSGNPISLPDGPAITDLKNYIAPAGMALALFCFLLPWFTGCALFRCTNILGIQSGPFGWFMALVCIISIFAVLVLTRSKPGLARVTAVACAIAGIAVMLILANTTTARTSALVSITIASGWYGSLLGLIVSLVGAFLITGKTPRQRAAMG